MQIKTHYNPCFVFLINPETALLKPVAHTGLYPVAINSAEKRKPQGTKLENTDYKTRQNRHQLINIHLSIGISQVHLHGNKPFPTY
jgi:hypothetical protein